ncbi:MAG: hypothetical protein QF860_06485 [Planctomycetota bacterium]|nr:hypothetical protein [Planctomycetota bacterium]
MTREKTEPASPGALLAGEPRAVLARITTGDPLSLRALVADRAEEHHLLVDGDAVHLRTLAHCARHALDCPDPLRPASWLAEQVDLVLDRWCAEEGRRGAEEGPGAPAEPASGVWVELAGPLGIEPDRARRACGRFNLLPDGERAAFFALVLDRRDAQEHARGAGRSLVQLAREARRALAALLARRGKGAADPP